MHKEIAAVASRLEGIRRTCYFLLNYAFDKSVKEVSNSCYELAIFFWIMLWTLILCTECVVGRPACYFLLNYAPYALDIVSNVRTSLLFSFELCCIGSILRRSLRRTGRRGSCYFLLNYAAGKGCGVGRARGVLLFSFELCRDRLGAGVPSGEGDCDLLFSFELCSVYRSKLTGSEKVKTACYFLLNYAS